MSLRAYMDEVRQRAEAATAGPWRTKPTGETYAGFATDVVIAATAPGKHNRVYATPEGGTFPAADQEFIAGARQDIPRLLAIVEALADAARTGVRWMEWWLEQNECECEPGAHRCGRTERERELASMRRALEVGGGAGD